MVLTLKRTAKTKFIKPQVTRPITCEAKYPTLCTYKLQVNVTNNIPQLYAHFVSGQVSSKIWPLVWFHVPKISVVLKILDWQWNLSHDWLQQSNFFSQDTITGYDVPSSKFEEQQFWRLVETVTFGLCSSHCDRDLGYSKTILFGYKSKIGKI